MRGARRGGRRRSPWLELAAFPAAFRSYPRWLVIGPDHAANLLEVIVLITAEGDELIIHAMPIRASYRKLLEP